MGPFNRQHLPEKMFAGGVMSLLLVMYANNSFLGTAVVIIMLGSLSLKGIFVLIVFYLFSKNVIFINVLKDEAFFTLFQSS
jgi:hypothetical protein